MAASRSKSISRPSDAVALAVRTKAPIFVAETVMERHAIQPEEDVERALGEVTKEEDLDEDRLSAFKDFVNTLDLDDIDDEDE